jgi:hypothetical protein
VSNLKVLVADPVTGRLTLGLSRPPVFLDGIDLLVQIVALLLMENGGRSIATPGRAGGLRNLLGSNINPDDPAELFADVRLIVSQVEQTIKEEQVSMNRPPSVRLQSLPLIDIIPDADSTSIEILISVVNEEQQQSQAVVVI